MRAVIKRPYDYVVVAVAIDISGTRYAVAQPSAGLVRFELRRRRGGIAVRDARGAISVTERTGYIGRIRTLARKAALAYVEQRESLGFPLLKGGRV